MASFDEAKRFITAVISQSDQRLNTSEGSAINTTLINPAAALFPPILATTQSISAKGDLSDPNNLNPQTLNSLLRNLLVTPLLGARAVGQVQIFFSTNQSRSISDRTGFCDASGSKVFFANGTQQFTPTDHVLDPVTNRFYIVVECISEKEGTAYNVSSGTIVRSLSTVTGAVAITNLNNFVDGVDVGSGQAALDRARRALSTRDAHSRPGIESLISDTFGARVRDVAVVGAGDPEMIRDKLFAMSDGSFAIGRDGIGGRDTGIHILGRSDVYAWFTSLSFRSVVIDKTVSLRIPSDLAAGSLQVICVIDSSQTRSPDATGTIVLGVGLTTQETIRYTSVSRSGNNFTFTLSSATINTHLANELVRSANHQIISNTDLPVLPVLDIDSIEILDPVTLQPTGVQIPVSIEGMRAPGWRIQNRHPADSFSANEILQLQLDEKRGDASTRSRSGVGSVSISSGRARITATSSFAGYQGRNITITNGTVTVTRMVIGLADGGLSAIVSGAADFGSGTGYTFSFTDESPDYTTNPIRINYYTASEIGQLQALFDNPATRVVTEDLLARSFLPVFVSFDLAYDGVADPADVYDAVAAQLSTGSTTTDGTGMRFEISDLVAGAYAGGATNVTLPFEVRVEEHGQDGSVTVRYCNPSPLTTKIPMVISEAFTSGQGFIVAKKIPSQSPTIPQNGILLVGDGILTSVIAVPYAGVSISADGSTMTFAIAEGSSLSRSENVGQRVFCCAPDFDFSTEITDGVISTKMSHRLYFGRVTVERR